MKKMVVLLLFAMFFGTAVLPGRADAYQVFTDEALFLAAAPGAKNISFNYFTAGAILPDTIQQSDISVSVMNFPMMMGRNGMSENSLSVTAANQLVVTSGPWSSPTFVSFTPTTSNAIGFRLTNQMSEGVVGLLGPQGFVGGPIFPGMTVFLGLLSDNGKPLSPVAFDIAGGINPGTVFFDKVCTQAAPTPVPGAVWLLGSALAGLVGFRRKLKA